MLCFLVWGGDHICSTGVHFVVFWILCVHSSTCMIFLIKKYSKGYLGYRGLHFLYSPEDELKSQGIQFQHNLR